MIFTRDVPMSFGPSPIAIPVFVASSTLSRRPATASPKIRSDRPLE